MKKVIIILMFVLGLSITNVAAKEYNVSKTQIGNFVENWKVTEGSKLDEKQISVPDGGFAWNEDFKNSSEMIEFDMNIEYNDGGWLGVMLRSSKPDVHPWRGNSCILFVINEEQIELQIYSDNGGGGGYMLEIAKNPIKNGVTSHIAVGAVPTDKGVQILFLVDGQIVINNIMPGITNESGYFTFFNFDTKLTITAPQKDNNYLIPCNVLVDGEYLSGSELSVSYDVLSTSENNDCEVRWYTKKDDTSENVSVGEKYVLRNEDFDKYIYAGIGLDGNEAFSKGVFLDSARDYMNHYIVMLKNWFIAYAEGEQKQIDEDFTISPIEAEDGIYIPLRFVAEGLGYEIIWNEENKSVSIKNDYSEILIEAANLRINNNKSFIKKEVFESSFGIPLYFDADTGVILIDSTKKFDETKSDIYQRLYYFLINGI